jgi:hypothetical protein
MKLSEVAYIPFAAREFKSEHSKWIKQLAKDLDLGLMTGSTVNVNMPYRQEGGCWFGGTLVFAGGVVAEEKRRKGICLPFEKRVEQWLKAVCKVLEQKRAEDYAIYINEQPTWSTNTLRALSLKQDNYTEMRVMAKVKDPMTNPRDSYPRICWWVKDEPGKDNY